MSIDVTRRLMADMIDEAVRMERERCATIAVTQPVADYPHDDQGRLQFRLDLSDAILGFIREIPK